MPGTGLRTLHDCLLLALGSPGGRAVTLSSSLHKKEKHKNSSCVFSGKKSLDTTGSLEEVSAQPRKGSWRHALLPGSRCSVVPSSCLRGELRSPAPDAQLPAVPCSCLMS